MNPAELDDLVIVSNREPFTHTYDEHDEPRIEYSAGGLTTALDGVVGSLEGTWVAWGSGDADFDQSVVDERGTVIDERVAAEYTLRRVELTDDEVAAYYYGYSNEALWPLCHVETAHTKFDRSDWETYRAVNERFAEAVAPIAESNVWIHDYHLALLPRFLRARTGEDLLLGHFWHVPWPAPDVFEICPQREGILRGLLANDAIGFHVDRFRGNFLECVDRLVADADVDRASKTVELDGRKTETYVAPVGVDPASIERTLAASDREESTAVSEQFGIDPDTLAVGVDRLDYTKGILERLDALDRALEREPGLRGALTYLQIASKSREQIPSYRRYHGQVLQRIDDLNAAYARPDWQPVVYTDETFDRETILATLERADVCVVSSRRDGLNLIAEEFVAASGHNPGVLLLSEFAGAAEVLGEGAVRINPFDTDGFADAVVDAVALPADERRRRRTELLQDIEASSLDAWLDRHVALFSGD